MSLSFSCPYRCVFCVPVRDIPCPQWCEFSPRSSPTGGLWDALADLSLPLRALLHAVAGEDGQPVLHVHPVHRPHQICRERPHVRAEETQRLVQLLHAGVAQQGGGHSCALAAPPHGELREAHPCLLRQLCVLACRHVSRTRAVPVQRLAPAVIVHAPPRVLHQLLGQLGVPRDVHRRCHVQVLASQHSPRQDVVRHKPHVLVHWGAGLGHPVLLHAPVDDGEVVLHHARRRRTHRPSRVARRREPVRVIVAHAPAAKFPLGNQLPHRLGNLLERRRVFVPWGLFLLHMVHERLPPVALRGVPRGPVQGVQVHVVRT
mmetsp:Transcript_12821/g.20760  ORF Transcript_12821/g.20760 Transcript_12821/m.20760 type:complete len:317 (+) Transcript_12821:223-1173(+)